MEFQRQQQRGPTDAVAERQRILQHGQLGAPRRVEDDGRKGEGGTDAADATTTNNSRNNDRPHDRLHHMSTGDLSYDTWDSSSGISYGGDSLIAANDDQGNGGNNGGGQDNKKANGGADAGDDQDYDHRSSISTNESAYRTAAAVAAAAALGAGAGAMDDSQINMGEADAAAGLGSSDHGGPLPVVGDDYMLGLNDVIDTNDSRSGGFGGGGIDGKNENGDDDDDDGRPHLNPHDRLHHMSTDALSCDTSGWDSKDFDNIDEMGLGYKNLDEESQRLMSSDGLTTVCIACPLMISPWRVAARQVAATIVVRATRMATNTEPL